MPDNQEKVIANPTYMGDIRHFFTDVDIEHMGNIGIDLSTYEGVKAKATSIYFQTLNGSMPPPDENRRWSAARCESFKNWIVNGYPRGTATPHKDAFAPMAADASVDRLRADIRDLDDDQIKLLKKAFNGLLKRKPDHEQSYFALAAKHWLPAPTYCLHHEDRYNPWHRVYLRRFEDGLRSVPGCRKVTLPYWHITGPLPRMLFEAPFDQYTLPQDIGGPYKKGYVTKRHPQLAIRKKLKDFDVAGDIQDALGEDGWSAFDVLISSAHDSGHGAIGHTMANQDVAAFDPVFWFFHANWDRLWWKWQRAYKATTVAKFRSTITGSTAFLEPPFNVLPPFDETADQTIDPGDVGYTEPKGEAPVVVTSRRFGSLSAEKTFRVAPSKHVSVRVKNLNRLNIPGTFVLHLRAKGESIARKAFFQSTRPKECGNCREKGLINMDFNVALKDIRNRDLSLAIELLPEHRTSDWFPLSSAGDPTVNIRTLLTE